MIRSMGGHCEAVTAIVLLSAEQSDALRMFNYMFDSYI